MQLIVGCFKRNTEAVKNITEQKNIVVGEGETNSD